MSIYLKKREDCRLCGKKHLTMVLQLTPTPPANAFVPKDKLHIKQECFPLDVFQCLDCGHVQLLDVLDPVYLFKDYVYVSGTSSVFVKHFEEYAKRVISDFGIPKNSLVVELGSNDGTLLKFFKDAKMRVLGIDPAAEIARRATESGIETLPEFFTEDLARELSFLLP